MAQELPRLWSSYVYSCVDGLRGEGSRGYIGILYGIPR